MNFNPEQLEAINDDSLHILCLAGAGAGKSTTMVSRVKRQVDSGVPYYSILVLTFTNAAAFSMKEKYKKLPGVDPKHMPEFRTFHAFCYSLLVKDKEVRRKLGYKEIPDICDEKDIKKLESLVRQKTHCTVPEARLEASNLTDKEQFEVDTYKKELRRQVREQNIITFDMLCYNVCALFEKDEECIKRYKEQYKYIVVDETQDMDPKQFRFVASFPETCHVYLVGDVLQNIYQFRNCTNEFIKMLSIDPTWKVLKLHSNYRSTRQICEFANRFSKRYADPSYRIEMEGQRDGDKVEVIYGSHCNYKSPVDKNHLDMLVDRLKENNKEESAILCRTNNEVKMISQRLREEDIQFNSSTKLSDVLELLNCALDNGYMMDWLSTFLTSEEYANYIRLSEIEKKVDIRWFLKNYGSKEPIKGHSQKIIQIRKYLNTGEDSATKFNNITKLLKIKTKCKFDKKAEYTNRQLLESIRDQIEEQEGRNIYVGTIHSAKGLEWSTVYVMGADDGMFQLNSEEMKNLYYVAITRAKNHLVVFRA